MIPLLGQELPVSNSHSVVPLYRRHVLLKCSQKISYCSPVGCYCIYTFTLSDATGCLFKTDPDSKVHVANTEDPGGPHVGHMNLGIWGANSLISCQSGQFTPHLCSVCQPHIYCKIDCVLIWLETD